MLAALAVVDGLTEQPSHGDLADAAGVARAVLEDDRGVADAAALLARSDRLAVVARGLCYPAAKETALKLQETTGMMAHGFSTADFRHGPIAVCGPGAPAVLIAGSGPADQDTADVRDELAGRGARSIVVGSGPTSDIELPRRSGAVECIAATIRGQQLALATCRVLGIDPDAPAGLNKITLTH
jgi:glucosamine--fructose-6-phosphate aminotransferase (isomerizing)